MRLSVRSLQIINSHNALISTKSQTPDISHMFPQPAKNARRRLRMQRWPVSRRLAGETPSQVMQMSHIGIDPVDKRATSCEQLMMT